MAKGNEDRIAEQERQKVVEAQNKVEQFNGVDTEFSLYEDVQKAMAKSQQYQAKHNQPTYEPNKPL
ncbi:hypothetical protein FZC84_19790 [Rossellomorea vietnamensis]|uniref:Uncharacterized protein n=1 Tax=Rossellomorea vietnamensis TaxID=218284 RepID=A0A5D4M6C9_9BACI|nr:MULTISPECIES: hypothetical protein [Bacillaceae]TYR97057.1 hypothetical protein FZC84_19790 [Rossellomorea vietnamensis]